MVRLRCAVILMLGVSVLSGCQSGPLAKLSRSEPSTVASTDTLGFSVKDDGGLPATDVDPRVAKRENRSWFSKRKKGNISPEYAAAKAELKNPERLMTAMARYQESVSEAQKNPQAMEIARKTYTTLLSDNPNSLDAMLGLARVDYKADRIQDADRMYQTIANKFPTNAEALSAVAAFYNQTDRAEKVPQLLSAALQKDPEDRGLRRQMGMALVKTGRPAEAITHFTKCEGQATALATIGQLLYEQKDYSGAKEYLNRAVERNPDLEQARTVLAALNGAGGVRQAGSTQPRDLSARVRRAAASQLGGGIE